ncbi:MAG: (Fe-S)-binding protein [Proteobacteria bacterium]|nr:(Fe-S)-binding protein [Pseudomonadota bacterium]
MRTPGTELLPLIPYLQDIRERCTECGACMKSCSFLGHYGTPKAIVACYDFTLPSHQVIAYECSLCGLCTAVCPEGLDPSRIFIESRRLFVDGGNFTASAYKAILGYEKCGISSLYSWYGIPEGCDTVFFPGCSLSGTRPEVVFRMFRDLRKNIPTLGVVLDCCTKPSHDLGRQKYFESVFGKMAAFLSCQGIKKVVVACPSCFKIFQQYGNSISVSTLYEHLDVSNHDGQPRNWDWEVSVHDPCAVRDETSVHQAVRGLLHGLGLKVTEMQYSGRHTICCGQGGMVGFVKPRLARAWSAIRRQESEGIPMVTYCAGCTGFLSQVMPVIHIADLIYRPEAVKNGNVLAARAPFTYLNRLMLKLRFKNEITPKTGRI